MEWLTPHEAFVFETHGLCVVEDVVPAEDLAAMNQWRGPRIGHNACHSPCRASPLRPPAHHQRKDGQRSRARVLGPEVVTGEVVWRAGSMRTRTG